MNKARAIIGVFITCLLISFPIFASSESNSINGKTNPTVAVWDVGTYADLLLDYIPDSKLSYFYNSVDMALAVRQNKADAMVIGRSYYDYFIEDFDGLTPLDTVIGTCEKALIFPDTDRGMELMSEVNSFIETCKNDGTMNELAEIWFTPDNEKQNVDYSKLDPNAETIVFGTDQGEPPYALMKQSTLMGFDLDFMVRFCEKYNYNLDIRDDGYDAITAGIQTGKYDIVGCGFEIEEEREEVVYFSDSMYTDDVIILVPSELENGGFFANISSNFEKTFMREGRGFLFVLGFLRTILMSVLAALFGTLLGFVLYFINRDGGRVIKAFISVFVTVFKLVPVLVILMMLYYIVFGNVNVDGLWAAVITFILIFGSAVFEIIDSGIDTVDWGQTEAAYTLGFSKNRTFFKILLPQAAKYIIPMYKDELIRLVMETSVVGYIAIQDLTRISDLVRAQTFEPFFPLIATAIVYIAIAFIIILLINMFYAKINPKNRNKESILKELGIDDNN